MARMMLRASGRRHQRLSPAALPAGAFQAWLPLTRSVRLPTARPLGLFETSSGRMVGYLP